MNHASLTTLATMVSKNTLQHSACTEEEILLVRDHQDCLACSLAKAKAIRSYPSSGIRPNIIGRCWSMDYQGPYAVPAIGGYTGKFLFVEMSRGYLVEFLVKEKSEAFECVRQVNLECKRYGHTFEYLQVDSGTVEKSALFLQSCHQINVERGLKGIEVNPVPTDMQERNTLERYWQTHANMHAAMMVDNDVLPTSFWGLASYATTDTLNSLTNSLCDDGHAPRYYFEGRTTDLNHHFRVGYGKPVVCTRVSKPKGPKLPGITRNEFGVCVGPGQSRNGAVWVYLPSRGTMAISLRYNVRVIKLGAKKQMSLEEGKQYLPTLGDDGVWRLVTRGDSNFLGKQFAMSYDEDLSSISRYDNAEIKTATLNSSIAVNRVMQKLENTNKMLPEEEEI